MENTNQQFSEKILKQFNSSFDFKRLAGSILSNWYWYVLALTFTVSAGYLYIRYTTKQYAIKSSILIDENQENSTKNLLSKLESGKESSPSVNIYNEMFILKSQDLINQVIDSLNLNVRYHSIGNVKETEIYEECPFRIVFNQGGYKLEPTTELIARQKAPGVFELRFADQVVSVNTDTYTDLPFGTLKIVYTVGPKVDTGYFSNGTEFKIRIENPMETNRNILRALKVTPGDGRTSLLDLSINDNLPQRGVDFMNALIYFYQKKELENITRSAARTREFINRSKGSMIQDLRTMDTMVENIKVNNEVVDPQAQSASYLTEKTMNEQRINQLTTQKQAIANLQQILSSNKNQVIAGLGVDDPILLNQVTLYNAAVQRLDDQLANYGPSHPSIQQVTNELASMRRRLLDATERIYNSLNISLQSANRNVAVSSSRIKAVPEIDRTIKDVRRNYDVSQNVYLYLYQKGIENEISMYAATNKSKVVIAPFSSPAPISPVNKNVYLAMMVLGLMIPTLVLVIKELLNNRVINENDIESLTTIPIIGSVSLSEDTNGKENSIVVGPHVRTGIAEQFRLIRANLEFMSASSEKKVFVITSSTSGEGKSFVSINLGITMTLAKKRVVIMEFDLRKPRISSYLGLSNEGGISGYLAGISDLSQVLKASGVHENLYIANCGPIPPNPGELLVLPTCKELIDELHEMFDVIIIDTAPIGLVSDALILSQYATINMFVVRQAYTVKDQLRMFDVLNKDKKLHNPAIIFNGVEFKKKYGYGYGSGYGYGYSYGQGYGATGEEPKKKKKNPVSKFFTK
ncbi:MAG: polysaccharide biosynthesis tyrosine autokinase [Flavipsychrobacter sp.]|nr:polysaccharide biosynthesis tyrosine autokinase [Flavipsychrobacter sp.]